MPDARSTRRYRPFGNQSIPAGEPFSVLNSSWWLPTGESSTDLLMRLVSMMAVLALVGCGGDQKSTKEADRKRALESSPEMQCILDAETVLKAPPNAPDRMDLAHILVRHGGVKNAGEVTRTREEACMRALEARNKLSAGGDWDAIFEEYSDAKGGTEGVLYGVAQDELEPSFAGAAFSLSVDELSYVVETARGFHVIWRKK